MRLPPRITFADPPCPTLDLFPFTDPRFQAAIPPLSRLALTPPARRYALLLLNRDPHPIVAYSLSWRTVTPQGETHWGACENSIFSESSFAIPPGASRFVSMLGGGLDRPHSAALPTSSNFDVHLAACEALAAIHFVVDAVLFGDGRGHGSNAVHQLERWRAEANARALVGTAVAAATLGQLQPMLEAYLAAAAAHHRQRYPSSQDSDKAAIHLSVNRDHSGDYPSYLVRLQGAYADELLQRMGWFGEANARKCAADWLDRVNDGFQPQA